MLGRAFEDQMLEQVRHASLAVSFVARTDQHGEVDGHLRLRVVREEQRAQTVVELVFGDALYGGNFSWRRWFSRQQVTSEQRSGRKRKRDGARGRTGEALGFHSERIISGPISARKVDFPGEKSNSNDFPCC